MSTDSFTKEFESLNITGDEFTTERMKSICRHFYEFGLRVNRGKIERLDKELRSCLLKVSKINNLLSSTKDLLANEDESGQLSFNFNQDKE